MGCITAGMLLALSFGVAAQTIDRAESLWRAQDFEGAKQVFEALLKANPKNADYRVRYGDLFAERFNPIEAGKLYEEAIELDPKNAKAYYGMAKLMAENFNPKASELADKALESNPKLYQAHEIKARIALEDDDQKKATEEADAALAIEPHAVDAIAIHVAMDLLADRESPWLAKLSDAGPGYQTVAHFLVINRRYEDAIKFYRRAIAVQSKLWSAHSELGISLMRLGREEEARSELELAFNNHFADAATTNTLRLMDTYKNYDTFRTPTTILKLNKKESAVLKPYVESEMLRAMSVYEKKYKFKVQVPIQVEVYPNHEDFAVRAMGMPGLGALGVTFNTVLTIDSPSGRPPGEFHWASTLWHELSHVYILTLTNERTPRWFTEGLAVHEETATEPDWGDRVTPDIIAAIRDKKLLPIAQLERGFIHPTFPAQVIVSYYQGGKICDYISERWGESKLLDMAHEFAKNRPTVDVIKEQLGMEPEAFDKEFLAYIDKQTGKIVANFETWSKGLSELNKMAKDGKPDEVIGKARSLEAMYPDYVEIGNPYLVAADACNKKNDTACAMEEYGKYSKQSGRDPSAIKAYATLLDKAGKKKEAAAALERLNFIYPMDAAMHDHLGTLYLDINNPSGAVREFQANLALHPIDMAGGHYNLARAWKAAGQTDKAREEAINALEAAPDFRPAQKLLLELSGAGH
jgi:tetratricopeptide (TPR) repeat protein